MRKHSNDWHEEWSIPNDRLSFGRMGASWYPIDDEGKEMPIEGGDRFERNGVDYVAVVEPNQRYVIGSNAKKDWGLVTLTNNSIRVEDWSGGDFRTTKEVLEDLDVVEKIDRLLTKIGIDRINIKMYQVGRGIREDLV